MKVSSIDWDNWTPEEVATLLFVARAGEVLLIRKKRGLGAGKINGPGGRLEENETPLECAIRETQEELLINPLDIRPAGSCFFTPTICHVSMDTYSLPVTARVHPQKLMKRFHSGFAMRTSPLMKCGMMTASGCPGYSPASPLRDSLLLLRKPCSITISGFFDTMDLP